MKQLADCERAGETYRLQGWVLNQLGAGFLAEHEAEHTRRDANRAGTFDQCVAGHNRRRRVSLVDLRYDRAARRKGGGRVAPRHRESEREIARPEHGDRSERAEHPAQVRTRAHRRRPSMVDDHFEIGAFVDDVCEGPQLETGTYQLTREPLRGEGRFPARHFDNGLAALLEGSRHRTQHGGTRASPYGVELAGSDASLLKKPVELRR